MKRTNVNDLPEASIKGIKEEKSIAENIAIDLYGVDRDNMYKKTRKLEILTTRQFVQYLLKKYSKFSLSTIGYFTGEKDHAAVHHSYNVINNYIESNSKIGKEMQLLESEFINSLNEFRSNKKIKDSLVFKIHKALDLIDTTTLSKDNLDFIINLKSRLGYNYEDSERIFTEKY